MPRAEPDRFDPEHATLTPAPSSVSASAEPAPPTTTYVELVPSATTYAELAPPAIASIDRRDRQLDLSSGATDDHIRRAGAIGDHIRRAAARNSSSARRAQATPDYGCVRTWRRSSSLACASRNAGLVLRSRTPAETPAGD